MYQFHLLKSSNDLSYRIRGQNFFKGRVAHVTDFCVAVVIDTAQDYIAVMQHCKMVLHPETAAGPCIVNIAESSKA